MGIPELYGEQKLHFVVKVADLNNEELEEFVESVEGSFLCDPSGDDHRDHIKAENGWRSLAEAMSKDGFNGMRSYIYKNNFKIEYRWYNYGHEKVPNTSAALAAPPPRRVPMNTLCEFRRAAEFAPPPRRQLAARQ